MEKIKDKIVQFHLNYNFHKLFIIVLFLSNLLYLYYILLIAYNNVLLLDDYWFMAKSNQYGIFGSISWWYNNWQGRFAPQLMTIIIVKANEWLNSLFPYTILLITLFVHSILRLFHQRLPSPKDNIAWYK